MNAWRKICEYVIVPSIFCLLTFRSYLGLINGLGSDPIFAKNIYFALLLNLPLLIILVGAFWRAWLVMISEANILIELFLLLLFGYTQIYIEDISNLWLRAGAYVTIYISIFGYWSWWVKDTIIDFLDFKFDIFRSIFPSRKPSFSNTNNLSMIVKDRTGKSFERLVCSLYEKHGFEAFTSEDLKTKGLITGAGDQGMDVFAKSSLYKRSILIQCKGYRDGGSVGNKAVQEVLAAREFYNLKDSELQLWTTGKPTKNALELARRSGVKIFTSPNIINFAKSCDIHLV